MRKRTRLLIRPLIGPSMHDLKTIRDDAQGFAEKLARRGFVEAERVTHEILRLDGERRALLSRLQEAQSRRNDLSKQVGMAKKAGDNEAAEALMEEVGSIKTEIADGEAQERELDEQMQAFLAGLPNLPFDDVPVGADESANVEHHKVGTPKSFNFPPRQHFELGEGLGLMDFEAAARMSGARFVVLKGALARLERALGQFMLDLHTEEFGYTEVSPPLLVRDQAVYGTAQLPKFSEDLFHIDAGFWLVPTAEVPLTNMVREQIMGEDELPLRMTAFTPCFRSEAGAAGRDTRGMIRMHQFSKVELVSVTKPDDSEAELERMLGCAEEVLKRLGLAYRVMTLSTGDMGFAARKTYDIEVWLPGQEAYREISSCSVCGDFQARRMDARYRPAGEKGTRFVHTLNGSGLAVGRALVAVLETYQQQDGSIEIPEVLRPYLGGMEVIARHG